MVSGLQKQIGSVKKSGTYQKVQTIVKSGIVGQGGGVYQIQPTAPIQQPQTFVDT